jgi:tetratricopeptide (TPR) repeat protein
VTGDVRLQIAVRHTLGLVHHARGDYAAAVATWQEETARLANQEATDFYSRLGRPAPGWQAFTQALTAWSLAELGEFAPTVALADQAMGLVSTIDHPWTDTNVRRCVAHMWLVYGDAARAIELVEPALAVAERWELRGPWPAVAAVLGYAYAQMGRTGQALPLLEKAVAQSGSVLAVTYFAEACLLAADCTAAQSAGERALALARRHEERGNEAYALRLLGAIAANPASPDPKQAETYCRQALALATALEMRPLVAQCHFGLGTLFQKLGRDEESQAELKMAAEMYRAMEMTYWLDKATRALAGVRVD